eukprot:scaffold364498_cov55-Attheya_sp.AAC.1
MDAAKAYCLYAVPAVGVIAIIAAQLCGVQPASFSTASLSADSRLNHFTYGRPVGPLTTQYGMV